MPKSTVVYSVRCVSATYDQTGRISGEVTTGALSGTRVVESLTEVTDLVTELIEDLKNKANNLGWKNPVPYLESFTIYPL